MRIRPHPLRVVMFAVSAWMPLRSQIYFKDFEPNFFDAGKLVLLRGGAGLEVGGDAGLVFGPDGRILSSAPRPGPNARMDYSAGTFWSYERTAFDREKRESTGVVRGFQGGKWSILGKGTFKGIGPSMIYRLGDGNWLGIAAVPEIFQRNGSSAPFAVLKANDRGELEVHTTMDAGLEKPFFGREGKTVYYRTMVMPLIGAISAFLRTEDAIILCTPFGHFWIFDAEDGHLRCLARLYPSIKDEELTGRSPHHLLPGIHGIGGRPDGKILISCRSEGAVAFGMAGRSTPGSDPEALKAAADEVNARFPGVEWWVLDPATGKLEREAAPEGLPTNLFSEQEVMDFNWRFLPNARIKRLNFDEVHGPVSSRGKESPQGSTPKSVSSH